MVVKKRMDFFCMGWVFDEILCIHNELISIIMEIMNIVQLEMMHNMANYLDLLYFSFIRRAWNVES